MSRIDELAKRYADHIAVPWQQGLPAANRVVMLVYEKELERHLRAKLLEFEQATKTAGHGWQLVDLTTAFAEWMGGMKYREEYFERPDDIRLKLDSSFLRHVSDLIKAQLSLATEPVGADQRKEVSGMKSDPRFQHGQDWSKDRSLVFEAHSVKLIKYLPFHNLVTVAQVVAHLAVMQQAPRARQKFVSLETFNEEKKRKR